jgi:hypothetical protein
VYPSWLMAPSVDRHVSANLTVRFALLDYAPLRMTQQATYDLLASKPAGHSSIHEP